MRVQVNWNAGCVNKDVRAVGRAVYVMNSVGFCYPSCPVREECLGLLGLFARPILLVYHT